MLSKLLLINDYLQSNGNLTFDEFKFNEIDAAILASLSYADFRAVEFFNQKVKFNRDIKLLEFYQDKDIKKLSQRYLNGKGSYGTFFKLCVNSLRFKDLVITNVEDKLDQDTQFFAMTFLIDNKNIIIFRGTDNTLIGWKEDLLTAIYEKVEAQELALKYAEKHIKSMTNENYIIGHSKGGNLAYFSFLNLPWFKKKLIKRVYNFDGNGFKDDKYDYSQYKGQIFKYVPSDDVVGAFFDVENNHEIVKSVNFSVLAHDLLSWKIDPNKPNEFLKEDRLTSYSEAFKISVNEWMYHLENEDVEDFLDFIFDIVSINEPETLNNFLNNFFKTSPQYIKFLFRYPAEKRKKLLNLSLKFIKKYNQTLSDVNRERRQQ